MIDLNFVNLSFVEIPAKLVLTFNEDAIVSHVLCWEVR